MSAGWSWNTIVFAASRSMLQRELKALRGADTRGAFVQPALYEAFGLTVIEAMTCGLPCFATNRGGPAEIIKNGLSGYHIECAPPTPPERCCCGRRCMPVGYDVTLWVLYCGLLHSICATVGADYAPHMHL